MQEAVSTLYLLLSILKAHKVVLYIVARWIGQCAQINLIWRAQTSADAVERCARVVRQRGVLAHCQYIANDAMSIRGSCIWRGERRLYQIST